MALPTLVKTWEFNPNVGITATGTALGTNRLILKTLIDRLTTATGWVNNVNASITPSNLPTVSYSCDGTTAGTPGDAVNRWTDPTKIVFANPGTAHSWIVLRFPKIQTGFEVLISCENFSTNGVQLTCYYSPTNGFTGGTVTARPTATDERVFLSNAGWGGAGNTDGNVRLQFFKSSDGESFKVVFLNSSVCNGYLHFEKPVAFHSGWGKPGTVAWFGAGSITNMLTNVNLNTNPNFFTTSGASGSGTMQCGITMPYFASNTVNALFTGANELSLNYPFLPASISSNSVGAKGVHGYFNDLWWGLVSVANGSTFPTTGTQHQFVQFGVLVFPWCQVAAQVT